MAVVEFSPRWAQQEWMDVAGCKGQTHHFFAPHGEQAEAREAREAVAAVICAGCEVLVACREYARLHREQGFWGGENDEQRVMARRRANRLRLASGI
ncbi:MAG: WhiB family transcriptional regulator [Acidimicrobiia bacterium]